MILSRSGINVISSLIGPFFILGEAADWSDKRSARVQKYSFGAGGCKGIIWCKVADRN